PRPKPTRGAARFPPRRRVESHAATPARRRGSRRHGRRLPLPHHVHGARAGRPRRARAAHDRSVPSALARGVAAASRLAADDAPPAGHARVHHPGGGALRARPRIRVGGVPQPPAQGDEARGGSHGDLRVRSSPHPSLGEESADPLAVQHLPRPGPPAGADQPAGQRQPRGRPVPGAHAVPVLRGAARRQAHLLGHLPRAPGGDSSGPSNAARSARAAPTARATSTRSLTSTGTGSALTRARASAASSRAGALLRRAWIMVAPPLTARRHTSTASRPLSNAASVNTIKRNDSSRAM